MHANIDLSKVLAMYHHQDMEVPHKDPEGGPTFYPRDWPKTLKMLKEYIRGFHRIYGKPLSYGLRDDMIA